MNDDAQQRPWTPPRVQLVYYVCVILILCNLYDALTTVDMVTRYGEAELNPLMRALLTKGPATFLIFKAVYTTAGALFLGWASYRKRIGWIGLRLVTAVYFANFLWQVLMPFIAPFLAKV